MTLRCACLLLTACLALQADDLQHALAAYHDLYEVGVSQGKPIHPDLAANILNNLTSHFNEYPDVFLYAGDFYSQKGDFELAVSEYQQGMDVDSARKVLYQKRVVEVLLRQKKSDEADRLNREILRADPQEAEARGLAASFLLDKGDKGDVDAAIRELQAVAESAPDNFVARFNLGRAYFAKGAIEQARRQFETVLASHPGYEPARKALAQLALRRGDPEAALQYAHDSLQADAGDDVAALLESAALLRKGQYGECRAALERLLMKNSDNVDALLELGVLDLMQKLYREAEEAFRKAYTIDPNNLRGLLGVAESHLNRNEPEQAVQLIASEVVKRPQSRDLRKELANVEFRVRQYDSAIADYQAVLLRYKDAPREQAEIYGGIGRCYWTTGQYAKATPNLEKARQLAPDNGTYISLLAENYEKVGRMPEAISTYREAAKIDPKNGVLLNNLAYNIANTGGDLDEALALAQRAREQLPQTNEVLDTIGWIYLKKELTANALEVFRDLTDRVKDNATFHYHYAIALSQKGDKEGALKELYRALTLRPSQENEIRSLILKLSNQ